MTKVLPTDCASDHQNCQRVGDRQLRKFRRNMSPISSSDQVLFGVGRQFDECKACENIPLDIESDKENGAASQDDQIPFGKEIDWTTYFGGREVVSNTKTANQAFSSWVTVEGLKLEDSEGTLSTDLVVESVVTLAEEYVSVVHKTATK